MTHTPPWAAMSLRRIICGINSKFQHQPFHLRPAENIVYGTMPHWDAKPFTHASIKPQKPQKRKQKIHPKARILSNKPAREACKTQIGLPRLLFDTPFIPQSLTHGAMKRGPLCFALSLFVCRVATGLSARPKSVDGGICGHPVGGQSVGLHHRRRRLQSGFFTDHPLAIGKAPFAPVNTSAATTPSPLVKTCNTARAARAAELARAARPMLPPGRITAAQPIWPAVLASRRKGPRRGRQPPAASTTPSLIRTRPPAPAMSVSGSLPRRIKPSAAFTTFWSSPP